MRPEDYGPTIIGVLITELILGLAPIIPRLYVRLKVKRAFGWDDALIVLAWALGAVYSSCYIASVMYGYGQRTDTLLSPSRAKILLLHSIGSAFIFLSYAAGKASVAVLLIRIFPQRRLRYALWFIILTSIISLVFVALVVILHCIPIDKAWDEESEGACWSRDLYANILTFGGALCCLYDFILALIPLPLLFRLQMPPKEKCLISIIMCMGIFAGITSLLRTIEIMSLRHDADYAHDTVPLCLWGATEVCVVSIAACLPTLHPLFNRYSSNTTNTDTPSSQRTLRVLNALDAKRHRDRNLSINKKRQWHSNTDSVSPTIEDHQDLELAQKEVLSALSFDNNHGESDAISNFPPSPARIGPTTPFPDTNSEMNLCYELASGGEKRKPCGWFFKEETDDY